ncbi:hypothetical protein B0H14DRAFT_2597709 [Mycena olivaceomarginata]|nr:hypothetical protein B0H14DRAFT_2597709 [Mycena olivaceomarginata]
MCDNSAFAANSSGVGRGGGTSGKRRREKEAVHKLTLERVSGEEKSAMQAWASDANTVAVTLQVRRETVGRGSGCTEPKTHGRSRAQRVRAVGDFSRQWRRGTRGRGSEAVPVNPVNQIELVLETDTHRDAHDTRMHVPLWRRHAALCVASRESSGVAHCSGVDDHERAEERKGGGADLWLNLRSSELRNDPLGTGPPCTAL